MISLWWNLPGPSNFVDGIANDLREGRNVFLLLPENHPTELYSAINYSLQRDDLGPFENLSLKNLSQHSPAYELLLLYDPKVHERENWNVLALLDSDSFKGKIIWIDGLNESVRNKNEWINFFKIYAHASGSKNLIERTVFCVPIVGHLKTSELPFDNLLAHHWWWDRVSFLDIQLYVANKLSDSIKDPIERSIAINVIAAICGYDPLYAKELCLNWTECGDNFINLIIEEAQKRNWDKNYIHKFSKQLNHYSSTVIADSWKRPAENLSEGWARGIFDVVDGRLFLHPAASVMIDEDHEINQRVWRGQVQTLLPLIDEYRIKTIKYLAENYRYDPRKVHNNGQGSIIEIATIKYYIETNRSLRNKIDKDIIYLIRILSKTRNDLAHLRVINRAQRKKLLDSISNAF